LASVIAPPPRGGGESGIHPTLSFAPGHTGLSGPGNFAYTAGYSLPRLIGVGPDVVPLFQKQPKIIFCVMQ